MDRVVEEVEESEKSKQEKPFWQKWWFWLIVIVVCCLIAAGAIYRYASKQKVANQKPELTTRKLVPVQESLKETPTQTLTETHSPAGKNKCNLNYSLDKNDFKNLLDNVDVWTKCITTRLMEKCNIDFSSLKTEVTVYSKTLKEHILQYLNDEEFLKVLLGDEFAADNNAKDLVKTIIESIEKAVLDNTAPFKGSLNYFLGLGKGPTNRLIRVGIPNKMASLIGLYAKINTVNLYLQHSKLENCSQIPDIMEHKNLTSGQ